MTSEKPNLKTVVITGGTRGIGLETAQNLLNNTDYRLVLIGKDTAECESVQTLLQKNFPTSEASHKNRVHVLACDLTQEAAITRTTQQIAKQFKSLYGLVNNAGIYPFGSLLTTTSKAWDETFQVNLKSAFLFSQQLHPILKRQEGGARIVNIASTAGVLPNHFALAYSVSKAALIHLTKTLAKELGKDGIAVNCVCPGIVRSSLHGAYHESENELESFYAKQGARFPLGRVGETQDIAQSISFFLDPKTNWVTGEVFTIDGGRLLI